MEFPNLEPDPSAPGVFAGVATGLSAVEDAFVDEDGKIVSEIFCTVDPDAVHTKIFQFRPVVPGGLPGNAYEEIETTVDGTPSTITSTPEWSSTRQVSTTASSARITGVRIGVTYEVRCINRSLSGIEAQPSQSVTVTLIGDPNAPSEATNLNLIAQPSGYRADFDHAEEADYSHTDIYEWIDGEPRPPEPIDTTSSSWYVKRIEDLEATPRVRRVGVVHVDTLGNESGIVSDTVTPLSPDLGNRIARDIVFLWLSSWDGSPISPDGQPVIRDETLAGEGEWTAEPIEPSQRQPIVLLAFRDAFGAPGESRITWTKFGFANEYGVYSCLLYTSPSPRDS